MPYKVFAAGEEALASDVNSQLMSQTVARFTSAAQRTSQLTAPVLNQMSVLDDRPVLQRYNGSAWVDMPGVLARWAATNPNVGVAVPTDFTLTTFAMPFAGAVHLFGFAGCNAGIGADGSDVAMGADPSAASTPIPGAACHGQGPSMPANQYTATFPFSAQWTGLASGATVTIKIRITSSRSGAMGSNVSALFGQVLIVPTSF